MRAILPRPLVVTIGALCLLAAGTAHADTRISVQALDGDGYRLLLTSRNRMTIAEARRRVLPMGAELCGGMRPTLGTSELKHADANTGPADATTTFFQEISCAGPTTKADAKKDPATEITEEQKQRLQEHAKALTQTYLENLAAERYEAAYRVLSDSLQAQRSFERWQHALTAWRGMPGALRSRVLQEASVHVDPPNAQPGIYVVVKFEESFEQLPIVCGFLVWATNANDDARITRDAQAHVKAKMFSRMTLEHQRRFRRAKGCETT